MPRITRKQQKIFAENASNNGVFGSLQGNDPTTSSDPDAIQGRTAYTNGWNDATYSSELLPPLEEFQALQYLFSRQIAYTMQEGISEWDASTTYYKGALVKVIQVDGSFILYASLIDNNTGNAVTDTTKWVITNTSTNFHQGIPNWRADVIYSEGDWVKAKNGGNWSIFESTQNNNLNNQVTNTSYWEIKPFTSELVLFTPQWFDYQISDVSWLRADTFSWQDGTVYSEAYNHLVDDVDGKTQQTETVGGVTISFILADDGHKIAYDETAVSLIYAATGVAWYYILDTTNQRFKLPRTKYGFVGLRDTVGKYVPESVPNIKGSFANFESTSQITVTGAFSNQSVYNYGNGVNGTDRNAKINFDASRVSNAYQDDAPVQQRGTQMYLYFYVGQFTQSATEQTAGLNSELFNGKLDLDLGNITNTSKETIVGWVMPDLSAGVSKTTATTGYTAPSNGWAFIKSTYSYNTTFGIIINGVTFTGLGASANIAYSTFAPVKKNDVITYTNAVESSIFYPCIGG